MPYTAEKDKNCMVLETKFEIQENATEEEYQHKNNNKHSVYTVMYQNFPHTTYITNTSTLKFVVFLDHMTIP